MIIHRNKVTALTEIGEKILVEASGFKLDRITGSHYIYCHPENAEFYHVNNQPS